MYAPDHFRTRSRFRPKSIGFCVFWLAWLFIALFILKFF